MRNIVLTLIIIIIHLMTYTANANYIESNTTVAVFKQQVNHAIEIEGTYEFEKGLEVTFYKNYCKVAGEDFYRVYKTFKKWGLPCVHIVGLGEQYFLSMKKVV